MAAVLNVSVTQVYSLAAPRGSLPCVRIGGAVRFQQADVDAFIAAHRVEPRPDPQLRLRTYPTVRLTAADPFAESALAKYFREARLQRKVKKK